MTHLLNCKEVTTRLALGDLSQYSLRERTVIRFHLAICWFCRKYERQVRTIGQAFGLCVRSNLHGQDVSSFKNRLINELGKP